jgi:hypothetical protein
MRRYSFVPVKTLYEIDYNSLADDSIESTRKSVDGLMAVIEYRQDIEPAFPWFDNDETVNILESNYNYWNQPEDLPKEDTKHGEQNDINP